MLKYSCVFVSTGYLADFDWLARLVRSLPIEEAKHPAVYILRIFTSRSGYAVYTRGSAFFFMLLSFVCSHHRHYVVLLRPYEFYLWGLRNCQ